MIQWPAAEGLGASVNFLNTLVCRASGFRRRAGPGFRAKVQFSEARMPRQPRLHRLPAPWSRGLRSILASIGSKSVSGNTTLTDIHPSGATTGLDT